MVSFLAILLFLHTITFAIQLPSKLLWVESRLCKVMGYSNAQSKCCQIIVGQQHGCSFLDQCHLPVLEKYAGKAILLFIGTGEKHLVRWLVYYLNKSLEALCPISCCSLQREHSNMGWECRWLTEWTFQHGLSVAHTIHLITWLAYQSTSIQEVCSQVEHLTI